MDTGIICEPNAIMYCADMQVGLSGWSFGPAVSDKLTPSVGRGMFMYRCVRFCADYPARQLGLLRRLNW